VPLAYIDVVGKDVTFLARSVLGQAVYSHNPGVSHTQACWAYSIHKPVEMNVCWNDIVIP